MLSPFPLLAFGLGACLILILTRKLAWRAALAIFPELLRLEPAERWEAFWRAMNNKSTGRWMVGIALVVIGLAFLGPRLIGLAWPGITEEQQWWARWILIFIGLDMTLCGPPLVTRMSIRRRLRDMLARPTGRAESVEEPSR